MKKKKQKANKKKEEVDDDDQLDNNNSDNDDDNNENDEEINVNFLKGNYFIFATTNKKKLIGVPKSSKQPGTQLEIENYTKGSSKQFEIESIENGLYTIKSCLSGLYLKVKEGFKNDEVVQDEFQDTNEFKWIFEKKDDDDKCIYIKSAMSEGDDFYLIIDGYTPKPHSKIITGNFDDSQKFMLCRKA